jgi:hypothetical protein
MPHKRLPFKNKKRTLRTFIMSSSFFDKKHGETINTLSPGEITLYMQTVGFPFHPFEARVAEGEVLTDARGQGSLDRNITIL